MIVISPCCLCAQVGGAVRVLVSNRLYTGTVPGSFISRYASQPRSFRSILCVCGAGCALLCLCLLECLRGIEVMDAVFLQCVRRRGAGAVAGARRQPHRHHAPQHRLQALRFEVCVVREAFIASVGIAPH